MDNRVTTQQADSLIQDFFVPDEEKIKLLQSILEMESGRVVSFEEAEEIGIQLITLYECLARDRTIVPVRVAE